MELFIILASLLLAVAAIGLLRSRALQELIAGAASLALFLGAAAIVRKVASGGTYSPAPLFAVDALAAIVLAIIAVIGLAATAYSWQYFRQETEKGIVGPSRVRQYFILLNVFLAAMVFAVTVNSPILAWISIEVTTLSTALLISFYNKPSTIEAAWKYLIISSIGLLMGFFGTLLYFTAFGTAAAQGFVGWPDLIAGAGQLDPLIAKAAFIFVLIGYGTKVGFVPMHTWKPDVYSKAPAPLGALFSGALLPVAFITILRFKSITDIAAGPDFSRNLFVIFGVMSMAIPAAIILTVRNYKRLLAYSSIENAGLMALGFGFGGLGAFAAVLHMIYHSLIKAALFFLSGNFLLKYHSAKIRSVRSALAVMPATAVLFLVGFFAITGAPPFGIFFSKILLLSAGLATRPVFTAAAALLSVVLFVGFFKQVSAMTFGARPEEIPAEKENVWLIIPPLALILLTLYLSFALPAFLQTLIREAIRNF